jgi:hypothetical protein
VLEAQRKPRQSMQFVTPARVRAAGIVISARTISRDAGKAGDRIEVRATAIGALANPVCGAFPLP